LAERSNAEVVLNTSVDSIGSDGVSANGVFYPADRIISALPGAAIGHLTGLWNDFEELDLWVVNLAYEGDVLPKKGFGYLVPTQEGENLLGMVWDSAIFPQQSTRGETRVTAMMRHGSVAAAEDAMRRHLGVSASPVFTDAFLAKGAIPQFPVGYWKRLARFEKEVQEQFPSLILVGNYLKGASVDACIGQSPLCVAEKV
jgi:oxygen-dependent protoporphyrinogen oxidase